jgi:hypothetical protein
MLSKIKHHSEGLVLRYGEDVKVRERMVRDLHAECMALAEVAHQANQDPRMTPLQKQQIALDVESLKTSLGLALQALAINKRYVEDCVQTEFMVQSIAQRWVAGLPPDFGVLGPVTPPQEDEPVAASATDSKDGNEEIRSSLSSSLANPNWPESPQASEVNGRAQTATASIPEPPRSVAPHRVMPMPRAPAVTSPNRAPQKDEQAPAAPPESGKLSAVSED